MKNLITLLSILIATSTLFSQNKATGKSDEGLANKQNVLVIPFESKMYISDINRELIKKNSLTVEEIKAKFRAALDQNIYIKLKPYYTPLSFYSIAPQEARRELAYIYNSIGYKYEIMKEDDVVKKENVGGKLMGKLKKNSTAKKDSTKIVLTEKYMNTKLTNKNLLTNLNKKNEAIFYIFINELDIKRSADENYKASEEQYKREIKVHYTIFDNTGKEVHSGAIKARFPSTQNDIDKIIRVHFPLIAQRIVEKIRNLKEEKTD